MRIKVQHDDDTWFFESDHGLPSVDDIIVKAGERFRVRGVVWEVAVVGTKAAVAVVVEPWT